MFNYFKYMITVPRKFILNWAISGGVYLLILPLAFANSSVEPMTRTSVYLTQSIVAVLFGLFVTFAWTNIMFIPIATMELSQTLDYVPLMKATLQAALAGVTFGALGFALGAFTGKSSMAWAFGGGLMAFEYLTNSLAGTNEFFEWFDDNLSSFGAYGNPYQDGLFAEDLLLVIGKIALFLVIGFIGFRNRSLNLR